MPRLVACGSRTDAFDSFKKAHQRLRDDYVAMLVDSEDPVDDIEKPWDHLHKRDRWSRPKGAVDEQALLMVTCMESWIVADCGALQSHYGADLQENALPTLHKLEERDRHAVQGALKHATRHCKNRYAKGKRSFEVLGKLNPDELRPHLPSFARCEKILQAKL